jgi:TRAP-type transport system periplasmic protein
MKQLINKVYFIVFICMLTVIFSTTVGMTAEKHLWKFAVHSPSVHVYTKIYKELAVMIKEATNGEVEVTMYSAGELPYKPTEFLKMCSKGVIEMAEVIGSYIHGDLPILALPDFPYLAMTEKDLGMFHETVMPYIFENFRSRGVEPLNYSAFGARQLALSKPIKAINEIKGMKIRTNGGLEDQIIKIWGGIPVFVTMSEVYLALQRGIMEGVMTAQLAIQESKTYEVAPYVYKINGPKSLQYIIINERSWKALSEKNKKAIGKVALDWAQKWNRLVMHEYDDKALEDMVAKKQVKSVTEISMEEIAETQKALLPFYKDYVEQKMQPKGPEAYTKALKVLNIKP